MSNLNESSSTSNTGNLNELAKNTNTSNTSISSNTNINTNINSNTNNLNMNNIEEIGEPKSKTSLHRINEFELGERSKKNALIVVNMQNCFFRGGSLSMIPSENINDDVVKEKEFVRKINKLIGLFEEDVDYFNAGLAGSPVIAGVINPIDDVDSDMKYLEGSYQTGTRKKYFFDHIVYTQTAYPPDHKSFSSHHYLREKKQKLKELITTKNMTYQAAFNNIKEDNLDKHFWAYVNGNFENTGMNQFNNDTESNTNTNTKLWSDHALMDGSDVIIENQMCYRGIEFHPRLNIAPLYRPNANINPQVYINKPQVDGRGRIIWLEGDNKSSPKSAFMNDKEQSTGLSEFLKTNDVEQVYVVGLFRDIMVEATLTDAIKNGFENVNLIYDATLPFGIPTNDTKVNNKYYFKDKTEIQQYIENQESSDIVEEFQNFLNENNPWTQALEKKNINVINSSSILETIKIGKEGTSCGFVPESLIKNFDLFFKTGTTTSRKKIN